MKPIKRKIWAIVLASILTIGIIGGVYLISHTILRQPRVVGLQAIARDYGTITLDCNYSETNHTLGVNQTTTYINHSSQTLYEVKFHIYANAYQENAAAPAVAPRDVATAYPHGFDAGYIKMTTPHITLSGVDNTIVTVKIDQGLPPQAKINIDLQYTIQLANVKHRLGYTENAVNLGNFYAIPVVYDNGWQIYPYSANGDPFYNEPYNFDVHLTVPEGYQVATSGFTVDEHHYRGYVLRDFAMVLSRKFQTMSRQVGNTTVTYYYFDDPIAEISLYTAGNALAYFSNQFLDYPYTTLAVVQTDFLEGGMEYGALVYISHDVTDQQQYQIVIIHEIAHQWWYGIIGNRQTHTPWLDEGLAEYCTAVFLETHPQYGKTLTGIADQNKKTIAMFENIMDEYHVPYSREMNRDLMEYNMPTEYAVNAYARAMLLFYAISEMVGYQNLNQALATFAQANAHHFGTKYQLATTLETELGYDLVNFINNYLAGEQDSVL